MDGCGTVRTLAGSGKSGLADGHGMSVAFTALRDITSNKSIFYITDGNRIRMMDEDGNVTTIAGQKLAGLTDGDCSEANFNCPWQVACGGRDHETLYVVDYGNHAVRAVSLNTGNVTTITGGKIRGFRDGAIAKAALEQPVGISVDISGHIFVCDRGNDKIRIIKPNMMEMTTLEVYSNNTIAELDNPHCLLLDESTRTLYFTQDHCICKVDLQHLLRPLSKMFSLSEDLMLLVDNKDLADVVFQVEDKQIFAYKSILIARSSYFSRLFSSGMKESYPSRDEHVTTIPIQDASYDAFRALIVYLITDKVSVDVNDWKMVCQLLILSDRYEVVRLKSYCETTLARQIRVENVVEILCLSDTHSIPLLKEQAITFICKHHDVTKDRAEMKRLTSSLIIEIMKKQKTCGIVL